jgi:hypothetical protein
MYVCKYMYTSAGRRELGIVGCYSHGRGMKSQVVDGVGLAVKFGTPGVVLED